MKNLAIIPARSGSKGLKNKNIIQINGQPLIAYTINAALSSNCFDTVMVSTDSLEYATIAKKYNAEVPFLRSQLNSGDASDTWDVVREVLNRYLEEGKEFDYVAILQPTSPLRTAEDIKNAFKELSNDNANNVISVVECEHPVQWCFQLDSSNSLKNLAESPYIFKRRQELKKYYHENGAIYIVKADKILNKKYNFYNDACFAYVMKRTHSVDIDEKADLYFCEALMKEKDRKINNE